MSRAIAFLAVVAGALVTCSAASGAEAPTSITVTVPDYKVERVGDFDEVTIPGGGQLLAEEGRPQVPYYNTVVEYPRGYRIQEVTLTDKSGERADSGLMLATVTLDRYAEQLTKPGPPKKGVYPVTDYGWEAVYADDGSATLVVSIFPLSYDPITTRSTFYRNYEFGIRHVKTGVSIASVKPTATAYEPGDTARLVLSLANEGEPQDVVVRVKVRKAYTLESVADIPAKTVSELGKVDSILVEWPTKRRATGSYAVDVVVQDRTGNRLDRAWATFRLGTPAGEVSEFTVTPQHFRIGDSIRLRLGFKNSGSCAVTGTGVFRVMKGGDIVEELRQEMPLLKPGGSRVITQTWSSKDAERSAAYYAVGYVEFEGMTSEPKSAMFSTNKMPSAEFALTPETAAVGAKVLFDASASADEDGSIAGYRWEFDDGGEARDRVVTHVYHQPGEYEVRLTITDNEGGTGAAVQRVAIAE